MAIKRRLTKPKPETIDTQLARMGEILASGFGDEAMASFYMEQMARRDLGKLQSIVATAEENRSWKHLDGCYTQAMTLYVLASVLYERHPEHVIMSDVAFDRLARWLLRKQRHLSKEFMDWYMISALDLKAGTGMGVQEDAHIRWMVAIHTGTELTHGSKDTARLLRGKSVPRAKPSKGKARKRLKRPVRKAS